MRRERTYSVRDQAFLPPTQQRATEFLYLIEPTSRKIKKRSRPDS